MRLLRRVPTSTSGALPHDPLVGLAELVISGMWAVTGRLRRPGPPRGGGPLRLTVLDRRPVARDGSVVAVTFAAADGSALPRWHPGAHLDLTLPSGRVRQYSLCGDPADTGRYRIAVRRVPHGGGGSVEVHDALPVGATVGTHGPRNAFPLALPGHGSPARRLRFIAGGIGITPILPMLAVADRAAVDWSLTYCGRSRAALPFLDELGGYGPRVRVRTDDAAGVPTATELLADCPPGTAVYACGPAPMLAAIRAELAGRRDVELHFERFAAPPVLGGRPMTVRVASTGATVPVAADEPVLAALQRAGVEVPYSCRQGFCGTCRTRVRGGRVEHRDTLLTGPERAAGWMLVCVSRGEDLTLEL